MKKLAVLREVLGLLLLGLLGLCCWEAYQVLRHTDQATQQLLRPNGILDETRKAVVDVHRGLGLAAVAEQHYYVNVLEPRSRTLLDTLNTQARGLNLPLLGTRATQDLDTLHESLLKLNLGLDQVPPLLGRGQKVLDSLNQALLDLDQNLINAPEVKESLTEIAVILKKSETTLDDTNRITQAFARIMEYLDKKVEAPATKKQKVLAILEMVYKAALIDVALHTK